MAAPRLPAGDEESESIFLTGYRNYLVYCDDSGLHDSTHYAFGSLWIPAERRGDLPALVKVLRDNLSAEALREAGHRGASRLA